MAVYVVTWNLNKERVNYAQARSNFITQLEKYENKADQGLESVRFIFTAQTTDQIDAFLRQKLDNNDRLFVTKLVSGQHQGWLHQTVWDWINSHL